MTLNQSSSTATSTLKPYLGLGLLSACVIALEVTLTRMFSIMIWYHFAYLIVGLALLGGGAAGTYLAVRRWEPVTIASQLGTWAIAFSLSILASLAVIANIAIDPLGDLNIVRSLMGLAAYFVCVFAMFFLGGLCVAGAFAAQLKDSHRLYFADLLGASLATLLIIALIRLVGGPGALILIAGLALVGGWLFYAAPSQGEARRGRALGAATAILIIAAFIFNTLRPIQLAAPPSKELGSVMQMFGIRPELTRWNPVARVDVLEPATTAAGDIWIAGQVSPRYKDPANAAAQGYTLAPKNQRFITLDGTSMTSLHEHKDGADLSRFTFFDYAVVSAPYKTGLQNPRVLLIGVGGGIDIVMAQYYKASSITAIDLNSDVVDLVKGPGPYADYIGNIATQPGTTIETAEGRSFLTRDTGTYDIIQGVGLDNFAALNGGAYVLAESYLYTVESIELALNRLSPNGFFSWSRDLNEPPREMLRLSGLAAEALRRRGITKPTQHIAIVANQTKHLGTLLVSPSPISAEVMKNLRAYAAFNSFDVIADPTQHLPNTYTDYLASDNPRAFEASYPYNIAPATDERPFFNNYFKWTNIQVARGGSGDINTRLPIGNFVLLTLLTLAFITAIVFVVFPLWRYQRAGLRTPNALPMLAYFAALGAGYMFVQVILIQRLTLFIGYPTQAITTTIFSMLIFSAVGSMVARRFIKNQRHLQLAILALCFVIGVYLIGLAPLVRSLLQLPDTARIVTAALIIAPLAVLMGMPFPTGLRQIAALSANVTPWAWGMNGVFSVLGSTLVIFVSMLSGFNTSFVVGALLYALAAVVAPALFKRG